MGIDRDVWLKALADVGFNDGEDDQSALTCAEFGEMMGLSRDSAERRLEKLTAIGAAVKTRKWANGRDGRRVHMWAYRLVEKKPEEKRGRRHRSPA